MKMSSHAPTIAIIGAGLGGCAAAVLLQQQGVAVTLFEQAGAVSRLGAGIHLSPNVTRVLDRIGILDGLLDIGFEPRSFTSRAFDTGELTHRLLLHDARERWGAPYMTVHRGDFHALLAAAVQPGTLQVNKRLVALRELDRDVQLEFADGSRARFDLVIGADGVNSRVREIMLGPERPTFGGYIAHRAVFPAALLEGLQLEDCTKWWSEDKHLIVYFLTRAREEFYIVTGVPMSHWDSDAASRPGTPEALRADFAAFEPRVQQILSRCPEVSEWPLWVREPQPLWDRGRIVMLGDACHPMKPHMGQGAAMAIEDAAMLVRCLLAVGLDDHRVAYALYRANRIDRASAVQAESGRNRWLRHDTDPGWVFGYDVFTEPLRGSGVLAA
jgi:6-hydroxynicotinate 3-monooxygenase